VIDKFRTVKQVSEGLLLLTSLTMETLPVRLRLEGSMELGLLEELEANTDKEGLPDEARYNHVNDFRFFTSNDHATMYRDTSSSNSLPGSPSPNLDEDNEHTAVVVGVALPGDIWVKILIMHGTMQCICVARLRRVSRAFRGHVDKTLRLAFMNSPLLQARMELRIAPHDRTLNWPLLECTLSRISTMPMQPRPLPDGIRRKPRYRTWKLLKKNKREAHEVRSLLLSEVGESSLNKHLCNIIYHII
jgi:hypothetical protein